MERPNLGTWVAIGLKGSKLLAIIKTVKALKLLISLGSLLVSAFVYGLTLGPWFAVGLLSMLTIHEMGHVIALRQKHLPASLPVFIPFLGAAIFTPPIKDRETEAYVAYGGPLIGSIAAIACFMLWVATGGQSEILLLISYIGVYINLFNLIPINPLDGGRITQAVGSGFKYLGLALVIGLILYTLQPGMILVLLLIMMDFHQLGLWVRPIIAAVLYICMVTLFALGYSEGIWWINLADVAIGLLLLCGFVSMERIRFKWGVRGSLTDQRPMPALPIRLRWLAIYAALVLVLSVIITIQNAYLPVPAKANSQLDESR
jgi:Zn-dependent protease